MLQKGEGDQAYEKISGIMEEAFIEGLEIEQAEQVKFRGHGKPNIKHMAKPKITMNRIGEAEVYVAKSEREAARLKEQERRCAQHAARIKKIQGLRPCAGPDQQKYDKLREANIESYYAIRKNIDIENQEEKTFLEMLSSQDIDEFENHETLEKQAKRYAQRYSGIAKQISERRKEERAERMKHKRDDTRNISRTLKAGTAQPLTCVKRIRPGPNKEEIGTYTMDPMEIDDNARTVWNRVYKGVTEKMDTTAFNFM